MKRIQKSDNSDSDFTIQHTEIFPGGHWSRQYGSILLSTLWSDRTNEKGKNTSTLSIATGAPANNNHTAHIRRIIQAVNDGLTIYGALKDRSTPRGKISSAYYYQCTPIFSKKPFSEDHTQEGYLSHFSIKRKKGDIRDVIKKHSTPKEASAKIESTPKLAAKIKYKEQYLSEREFIHRHTIVQEGLRKKLAKEVWPFDIISYEKSLPSKKRCDVAVLDQDGKIVEIYEVKPYSTAALVIREATGQLLQYYSLLGDDKSYLRKLIAVGPERLKKSEENFFNQVRDAIQIGIGISFEYMHVACKFPPPTPASKIK